MAKKKNSVELLQYKVEQNTEESKSLRKDLNSNMTIMSKAISEMSKEMISLASSIKHRLETDVKINKEVDTLKKEVADIKTFATEVTTLTKLLKKYVFPTIGFMFAVCIAVIVYIISHSNFLVNFIESISERV